MTICTYRTLTILGIIIISSGKVKKYLITILVGFFERYTLVFIVFVSLETNYETTLFCTPYAADKHKGIH